MENTIEKHSNQSTVLLLLVFVMGVLNLALGAKILMDQDTAVPEVYFSASDFGEEPLLFDQPTVDRVVYPVAFRNAMKQAISRIQSEEVAGVSKDEEETLLEECEMFYAQSCQEVSSLYDQNRCDRLKSVCETVIKVGSQIKES